MLSATARYSLIACALLAAALAAAGWLLRAEVHAHGVTQGVLAAEQAARRADVEQAAQANADTRAALTAQTLALGRCTADAAARIKASAEAAAAAQARASGLQRVLAAERRARSAIYAADPDARAWAETLLPLSIEQQLRTRA